MADKLILEDADFLVLVHDERVQSIGFDNDDELASNREKALEYMKGEVDIASLPNRSKAVDTTLPDAVETVLPDLMDIFTGGEDVATFQPEGEEDVDAAAQETDYVNHVVFNENAGWLTLYTHIKDALTSKIGVVKVWGETYDQEEEEHFTGKSSAEIAVLEQMEAGEIVDVVAGEPDPETGEALFDFRLVRTTKDGCVKIDAVPPEDFTAARDTVILRETTYCAMRSRPRAQTLIADGYDADDVAMLSPYGSADTDTIEQARDTAGENNEATSLSSTMYNLHTVEIVEHYIRVDADGDGQPELWCVVTGGDETVLLKKERVDRIPFAVSTPYIVTHRLYGQSLYDKLGELQRIKTVLIRMMLDSGFFAMNQRSEVAMDRVNQFTLGDLLNNIPGAPIRSKSGDAVRPISAGQLGFDIFGAMEQVSSMAEQRSGIVRNAQGLNPDTLHDTAKGAMVLIGAAQKRTRMIARVFAETGIKDLFLLVHAAARSSVSVAKKKRLRGNWVDVDPSSWGVRNDMNIEIGVGSGGREMELAGMKMVVETQEKLVALQGGPSGPFIQPEDLYNSTKRITTLAGVKGKYFSDPKDYKAPENAPPPPDPDIVKAQMDDATKRYQIDKEAELKREQMEAEITLKREQIEMEGRVKLATGVMGGGGSQVHFGGDPG
ncbi:MAG: hypothetical protein V4820_11670 [Pseudomonadota bacterium]